MTVTEIELSPPPNGRALGQGPRWLAALALLVLPACSGGEARTPVYPVSGKVTVAGEIPEGALVVLYPAGSRGAAELRPSGKVRKDGSFRLTTFEADDGAPEGDYTATLEWNKLIKRGQDFVAGPNVVPTAYASPESSPWKIRVSATTTELEPLAITK